MSEETPSNPIEDRSRDVKTPRVVRPRKKRVVDPKKIRAREIVAALVDRLFGVEEQITSMRKELNEHLEMIAEQQVKLLHDGTLSILAMRSDDRSAEQVKVTLPASVVTIIKEK